MTEAVSNVVVHAYREGLPPGEVRVSASIQSDQVVVTVEDDGVGMKPNLHSEGLGMGSVLITAMASEVSYDNRGEGVRLTMRFPCRELVPA